MKTTAIETIVANVRRVLQEVGLEAGAGLVVAASGGLDSTVLLDVLDGLGYRLHVAHLDHALRPDSADDSRFVAAEAKRRGLPCSIERCDVGAYARTEGLSLEEAGRRQRYALLDRVADQVAARFIALGHHADDQAETVLLRLLRGSGATGLGAMEIVREGRYLRPLLRVRRAEIEGYARHRGLRYRADPSNRDPRFLRNRVRGELMPLLNSYNPNIAAVLNRTAALLKAEDNLLAELTQEALDTVVCERCHDKVALDSARLVTYHIAVQRRVLRAALQGLGPVDFSRVEQVRDWIGAGDQRVRILGAGLRGQGCGTRYILRRGQRPSVVGRCDIPGALVLSEHGVEIRVQIVSPECFDKAQLGGAQVALDADRLGTQVQVRSLRLGDRFQPLGMAGHKKLSDFLIDAKWPKISRDEVLVMTQEEEIAWVAPLRPSHAFRIQSTTRRIALCTLRRWNGD